MIYSKDKFSLHDPKKGCDRISSNSWTQSLIKATLIIQQTAVLTQDKIILR